MSCAGRSSKLLWSIGVGLALGCGGKAESQLDRGSAAADATSAERTKRQQDGAGVSSAGGPGDTEGASEAGDAGVSNAEPYCRASDGCRPSLSPASCVGLAATCGPRGTSDCCASNLVPGGKFDRGNDPQFPASVGDFRLDDYEITVGRFRKFWELYPNSLPAAGSGKNPNDANDRGWDASWNASSLVASRAELTAKITCDATYETWTAGNDSLPMNCLDWFEAQAFCIWDGGRLPTEAEWNYAAAGGTKQREYPWGSTTPDCTFANFFGAAGGNDFCVAPGAGGVNRVGSESPKGDGLYGQADLAGNVWEWVRDAYDSYAVPCDNCSNQADSSMRVMRGGGFSYDYGASSLLSFIRSGPAASSRSYFIGARCARPR